MTLFAQFCRRLAVLVVAGSLISQANAQPLTANLRLVPYRGPVQLIQGFGESGFWFGNGLPFGWPLSLPVLPSGMTNARATGWQTDLAINGAGWFVLRDSETGEVFVSRMGDFRVDSAGYLVTISGLRVQGYHDAALAIHGDLQVDATGQPPGTTPGANLRTWEVTPDGKIWVTLSEGTEFARGQILLRKFADFPRLTRVTGKIYVGTPAAAPLIEWGEPGRAGLGTIYSGALDATPEPLRVSLHPDPRKAGPLTEGLLVRTGRQTDLGINGPGFFLVRQTNTSELFATRAGMFLVDAGGYLVTYDRLRVQGYTDIPSQTLGDVCLDGPARPPGASSGAVRRDFAFGSDGRVLVSFTDQTFLWAGQIVLFSFQHPERLVSTNHGLYANAADAGPQPQAVATGIFGNKLASGSLETLSLTEDLLAIRRTFTFLHQGALRRTGEPANLAIAGGGYFLVRNPTNGEYFGTRRGAYQMDNDGYLVTAAGFRLQGFSDAGLTTRGDLRVDGTGRPANADPDATVATYAFGSDGKIHVELTDQSAFVRGQILLENYSESFALRPAGQGLYTNRGAAGPLALTSPQTMGFGALQSGALEIPPPAEELTLPPRDGIRLRITGEPGSQWTIRATTNLTDWSVLGIITNASGETEFIDTDYARHPQRIYRVDVTAP